MTYGISTRRVLNTHTLYLMLTRRINIGQRASFTEYFTHIRYSPTHPKTQLVGIETVSIFSEIGVYQVPQKVETTKVFMILLISDKMLFKV